MTSPKPPLMLMLAELGKNKINIPRIKPGAPARQLPAFVACLQRGGLRLDPRRLDIGLACHKPFEGATMTLIARRLAFRDARGGAALRP